MKKWKSWCPLIIIIMLSLILGLFYYKGQFINTKDQGKAKYVKKVMNIWLWGEEADVPFNTAFRKMVKDFNDHNKYGVRVEMTIMKTEQYKTKIATEVAANNAPDLFMTWPAGYLKTYVEAGKVYPITKDLQKDINWENRYRYKTFDTVIFNNEIYAAPVSLYVTPMYYNKEIFKSLKLSVPKTYAELKTVVEKLKAKKIIPFAFGSKTAWQAALFSEVVQNRIGGNKPYMDILDGKGNWADDSFVKSAEAMLELSKLGAFPADYTALDYPTSLKLFTQGKAAMMVIGTWVGGSLNDKNSRVRGKVGLAKFPTFEGGMGSVDTWIGSPDRCIAVSTKCKYKEAAVALLKKTSDSKYQRILTGVSGNMPVVNVTLNKTNENALTVEAIELTKDLKNMFAAFDIARVPGMMGKEYNNTIQSILLGQSPKEALQKLQDRSVKGEE